MLKKIFKILLIVLGSIAGLILLIIVMISSGALNGMLTQTIEKEADKNINGELLIGSIKGNLLSDFTIHDILLTSDYDTLFYCREANIKYALIPLLRSVIRIDLVKIAGVKANLVQDADSTWNFSRLLKEDPEKTDTTSGEFNWKISLNRFSAGNMSVRISTPDTAGMIPGHIDATLRISAFLSGDTIKANLDSLQLITSEPDFVLTNLSGIFSKEGNSFKWENVTVQIDSSFIMSDGHYLQSEDGALQADVSFNPLDFNDFKEFIQGMKLQGNPDIELKVSGNESDYIIEGSVSEGNQHAGISGDLRNYRNDPQYNVTINVENIDVSYWTGNDSMKTNITGNFKIGGQGFDFNVNNITIDAELENLKFKDYSAANLNMHAEKKGDSLNGTLDAATFAGNVSLTYDLASIFTDPSYDILCDYNGVDISKITGKDSVYSDLNGNLHLNGRGITPEDIDATLSLLSHDSHLAGELLGNFELDAGYKRGNYNIDLKGFGKPYFSLDASGSGNVKTSNIIDFTFEPVELSHLAAIMGLPPLSVAGKITGNISGNADSLSMIAEMVLDSIVYDTIRVNNIRSEASATLQKKDISGKVDLSTGTVRAGEYGLKSAEISGEYTGNTISTDITLNVTDSLQASFTGSAEGAENPLIRIRNLGVTFGNLQWSTWHDSATVQMNKDSITISSFGMSSGDQNLTIDGSFAFQGDENIELNLNKIDLGSLPLEMFLPYPVSGFLTSSLKLTGTASEPVISSYINIDRIDINGFPVDSINTAISYRDSLLHLSGRVLTGLYESVGIKLDTPVKLAFNDSIYVLKDSPVLSGSVKIDSLDLSKISAFIPVKGISAKGYSDVNLEVRNTINDPVISGSLRLENGSFTDDKYGIKYNDIQLIASIDSSTLGLDTLRFKTGKGNLAMNGFVSLENTDSLSKNDFSLKLKAKDFQAVESPGMELNFNSDIDLSGTLGNPGFKGSLGVNRSKINIDYFNEALSKKTDKPDLPLLIQAINDTLELPVVADTAKKQQSFTGTDFYKSLEGELTLDIPGNTWITGKDMNFELNGSIRAVKAAENISLFGDLNVKRGYYKIYGRSFDFESGKITFTGSSEFNPDVDFVIVYSFRDIEKELRKLKLLITGKLMKPDLRFTLDDNPVEEKDAISYIVFGKSVNQLGEGEREKFSGQDVALGAAVTQLSSALKGVLQESAGIDVFEVTGGENWKSGSVTIGKYITNNLFLSYDRSFDFNKQSKTANTEKIMLEYQILRNLILKATNQEINSGFDLIFRKTWR
ncbi:MAG TPA: translocation/assembly module TamB domain-containing protein [Bacteroidales bacterium]|nr:translocation/assembly module TamB domain-containing protein [Bacteroidales bacterium]